MSLTLQNECLLDQLCKEIILTLDYIFKMLNKLAFKVNLRYHLYMKSKIWHKWTYLQNKNRLTDIENRLVVVNGGGGRGEEWIGSLGFADANYYIQDG